MIDLTGEYTSHLPRHLILREDECCLGYKDSYDYWLVFEEWEFRVYSYEWWSYDSIVGWGHENEDWYSDCDNYFQWADDFLDRETCVYRTLEFENTNPEWMAREIWEACDDILEDCYSITCDDWDWPNDKLINFIKEHSMNRVYCYYK